MNPFLPSAQPQQPRAIACFSTADSVTGEKHPCSHSCPMFITRREDGSICYVCLSFPLITLKADSLTVLSRMPCSQPMSVSFAVIQPLIMLGQALPLVQGTSYLILSTPITHMCCHQGYNKQAKSPTRPRLQLGVGALRGPV